MLGTVHLIVVEKAVVPSFMRFVGCTGSAGPEWGEETHITLHTYHKVYQYKLQHTFSYCVYYTHDTTRKNVGTLEGFADQAELQGYPACFIDTTYQN